MKLIVKSWLLDKKACKMLLWYFVLSCIYIVINSWYPKLVSNIFNISSYEVSDYLIAIAIMSIIQIILSSIIEIFDHNSVAKLYGSICNNYADILLDSDYDLYTKYSIADINSSTEALSNICRVGRLACQVVLKVVSIIATMYVMYTIAGGFIVIIALIYALGMVIMKFVFQMDIKVDNEFHDKRIERNQQLENVIYGFSEVRSFNMQYYYKNRIHFLNDNMYDIYRKKNWYHVLASGGTNAIDTVGLFVVIFFVIESINAGTLTAAAGMSMVMYVFRLIEPILFILWTVSDMSDILASCKMYNNIISYKNKHIDGSIVLNGFNSSMKIEDVSFAYNDADSVLNHVTMEFKKGERIGICGASGGGKTSLLKLLNKFYVPKNGRITIDGIDINDATDKSYRDIVGYVSQENIIFPGTLYDNITYTSPHASNDRVYDACKKASLDKFIDSLPDGLRTVVGPRGLKLSGGQKQRIALARMFLKDPQIILLDEATASLDNESEHEIQDVINNIHDKTVITIAHRLSTIKKCDVIYVLDDKTVVESGSHEQLMNAGGVYSRMVSYTIENGI